MAFSYLVLGQAEPSGSTATTLYTVPASTQAVCSSLVACNKGVSTTVRVAVRPSGATLENKHYILYNAIIDMNDSLILPMGLTLTATDIVTVYAATSNVSFSLFGTTEPI